MKLQIYCSHCQALNPISDKGILDRKDLEYKHGKEIKFKCGKCLKENSRSVKQVFASESKVMLLAGLLIGFAFMGVSVFFLISDGSFIVWPFFIGAFIMSAGFFSSRGSTSVAFNKS